MSDLRRRMGDVFRLERAISHEGAIANHAAKLEITTPSAEWSYAVSLPSEWPSGAEWIQHRDGLIRVRLRALRGRMSVLALDTTGAIVIDEVCVDGTGGPAEIDLVCAPLGACHTVVLRNARADGAPSYGVIDAVECIDIGPSEAGEELTPPTDRTLRPVENWDWYYGGRGRSLAERVRGARYSRLDRVKRMPWLENLRVQIWPHDDLSRALYISGLYEPLTMLVLRRMLRPGSTFIDVGANVGLFSMIAAQWVGAEGRVYAFEPSEREYGRLTDNLALNSLSNVVVLRQAVADRRALAALRVAGFPNAGLNTLGGSFAYRGVPTARIETVTTVTLDEFAQSHELQRIDVVKMDIEGSEYAALAGGSLVLEQFRPLLAIEMSREALAVCARTPEEVSQLLLAADYRVYRIGPKAELLPLAVEDTAAEGNVVAVPAERAPV